MINYLIGLLLLLHLVLAQKLSNYSLDKHQIKRIKTMNEAWIAGLHQFYRRATFDHM